MVEFTSAAGASLLSSESREFNNSFGSRASRFEIAVPAERGLLKLGSNLIGVARRVSGIDAAEGGDQLVERIPRLRLLLR